MSLDRLDRLGRPASEWAVDHGLVPFLHAVEVVLGQRPLVACAAVVAAVLLALRVRRAAALVALTTPATVVLTSALKTLVDRPRPPWQVTAHLLHSPAFPSGHTSGTTALVLSLVLATAAVARQRGWRPLVVRVASVAAVLVVALVGADRVLLGRHYPSDVLGGLLVGGAVAWGAAVLLGTGRRADQRRVARAAAARTARSAASDSAANQIAWTRTPLPVDR
ncbi:MULTISPECIES: phosphatase PAP2 family protein [unclassified Nocardioides]|uniref:phosphatase PAP2 family protein n=1 Tax=unclassified Nocardioides TaxID=2615069 RepID=UPI000702B354|nr:MULTISPECIES: phosphatase PAP2 family protein [unclassified Nocardioides]KRC52979.1 hypothetical protein ASE19_11310 [Nocardioides sp. Root79]KRC72509.1 hypothetical protein ASE20_07840 [Nocardioides sp. Root240]